MKYKTYPCELKFKSLVRHNLPVVAGFISEKDAIREQISPGVPVRRTAEEFKCSVVPH